MSPPSPTTAVPAPALRAWGLWAGLAAVAAAAVALALRGDGRVALALVAAVALVALAAVRLRAAIGAVLVMLVLVGDVRRLLIPLVGWSGMDPLLLLGPALALVLCGAAVASGEVRLDTPLARWTAALMAVMTLQIANPVQGGLAVGLAGVLFLMAPLFWFWVGRSYAPPQFVRRVLLAAVLPLGLAAMVFGFYQKALGYLPYQMAWYRVGGYTSLGTVEGGLAPISFFASSTEHSAFLVTTAVVVWAVFLKRRSPAVLVLLPLVAGVVVTGSRGPVVKVVVALAVMWAVTGRTLAASMPRFALALALLGGGVVWGLSQAVASGVGDAAVQNSLDRQMSLFSGSELAAEGPSTIDTHSTLLLHGYQSMLSQPLGHGLGATSSAALKFGGTLRPTETDVGDVMMATGLAGGLLYHGVLVLVVVGAVRYWFRTRSLVALATLGVLAAHTLMWLGGGLYAVSALTWLLIGSMDGEARRARSSP